MSLVMYVGHLFWVVLVTSVVAEVRNETTTEKETMPEYTDLLEFDPYLTNLNPDMEEDDYVYEEYDEIPDQLPMFLREPNNAFVLGNTPATLLCSTANALEVYFKCNEIREPSVQFEYMDPKYGVRVIVAELNITRDVLEEYSAFKYSCECHAWNSKGKIQTQGIFIQVPYIKKQFGKHPQSVRVEARQEVSFHCSPPPAEPPATIKWMRNGMLLETTEKTLMFPRVKIRDMANYTCIAENIAGRRKSDVAVLTVYVNGGWSDWTSWSPCDCGSETTGRLRIRTCTKPKPTNGGAPCRGQSLQKDDNCPKCLSDYWSAWSTWSKCSEECVRIRSRQCVGNCFGPMLEKAACVDGLCSTGLRLYNINTTLYVGIGITMGILGTGATILCVWCRCRSVRPGNIDARTGTSKVNSRVKITPPDLKRACNQRSMKSDNKYYVPDINNNYVFPYGDCSYQQASDNNYCEMREYIPSAKMASNFCTDSSTSSPFCSFSSHMAKVVTSSPVSESKVDVVVSVPAGVSENNYRDNLCLTVVK